MSCVLSLSPTYYRALKRLTLELAGIRLGDDHRFLVETRLSALARKEGFANLEQMIDELFSRGQTRLAIHVVSALLQRATRFFEDRPSFEMIGDILLPKLHQFYKGGTVRILSYGCSSGQEAYSIAILLDKLSASFAGMKFEIIGVDYPSWALESAKEGRFTHFEVQRGLPIRHLVSYFDRAGEDWVVKKDLREKVRFVDHNLLADIGDLGIFQIVMFCGKLTQYSPPAVIRILRSLSRLVRENGYLVLGSGEEIGEANYGFDIFQDATGCYKKHSHSKPENIAEKPISTFQETAKGTHRDSSVA
ncbi:MAG: CheR family methyltransferase [Robiginitomaculum sp.]